MCAGHGWRLIPESPSQGRLWPLDIGGPGQPLRRQFIELMDNPLLRIKMGRAGRKRVEEELQWSVVGGNLLAAYRSVLGHRGRP